MTIVLTPWHLIIILVFLSVYIFWYITFWQKNRFEIREKAAIFGLRTLFLILFIMTFLQFRYQHIQNKLIPAPVEFIWDNSQSMSSYYNNDHLSSTILDSRFYRTLQQQARIKHSAGSEKSSLISARDVDKLDGSGSLTNIDAMLQDAVQRANRQITTHLFLISDGQNHVGRTLPDVRLPDYIKLTTLGVGDTLAESSPKIILPVRELVLTESDSVHFSLIIENPNLADMSGSIRGILDDHQVACTQFVTMSPLSRTEHTLLLSPQVKGRHFIRFDYTPEHSNLSFSLKPVLSLRVKNKVKTIIMISHSPTPDLKFIRTLFDSDETVQFIQSNLTDQNIPDNSDLIIYQLSDADLQAAPLIQSATPKLILLSADDDKHSFYAEDFKVDTYLPFTLSGHKLDQSAENWAALPPVRMSKNIPAGKVIVSAQKPRIFPFILQQNHTILVNGTGLWNWKTAGYEKAWQDHYSNVFKGIVRWLLDDSGSTLLQWQEHNLTSFQNENIALNLNLHLNPDILTDSLKVILSISDSTHSELWRKTLIPHRNLLMSNWPAKYSGHFTGVATLVSDKQMVASDTVQLSVSKHSPELAAIGCNQEGLRTVSLHNKGQYFHISAIDSAVVSLPAQNLNTTFLYSASADYFHFILLILLASAEWIIRKRAGGI